jgi:hypothetical protein
VPEHSSSHWCCSPRRPFTQGRCSTFMSRRRGHCRFGGLLPSSEVPLQGECAPRTIFVEYRSLPAGTYEIRGVLVGSGGHARGAYARRRHRHRRERTANRSGKRCGETAAAATQPPQPGSEAPGEAVERDLAQRHCVCPRTSRPVLAHAAVNAFISWRQKVCDS